MQPGETTSDSRGCTQVTPEIGVTSTPVIDRSRGTNGVVYVVAMSKDAAHYHQRVHALDLALGTELFGGPVDVQAKYPGRGDNSDGTNVVFDPAQYEERAGLLLMNGILYTSWTSHCDIRPYTGWIIAYDAGTLAQTSVFNVTPNGNEGAIWMAGAGLAADSSGNIYFLDANGVFDATLEQQWLPQRRRLRECFHEALDLSPDSPSPIISRWTTRRRKWQRIPTSVPAAHGAARSERWLRQHGAPRSRCRQRREIIYVVNRDSMGKFTSAPTAASTRSFRDSSPEAYFRCPHISMARCTTAPWEAQIQAFPITNAKLSIDRDRAYFEQLSISRRNSSDFGQ